MKKKIWISTIVASIVLVLIIVGCIVFTQNYSKKIKINEKDFWLVTISKAEKEQKNYEADCAIWNPQLGDKWNENNYEHKYDFKKVKFVQVEKDTFENKNFLFKTSGYGIGQIYEKVSNYEWIDLVVYPFNSSKNYIKVYYH